MKVWLKRIGLILLIPIVLLLLVSVLLFVPPVQNFAVRKAMGYVAESTGINISFERIRLSYPLNLSVRNALIMGTDRDTLAYLDKLTVEVDLAALFDGNISIKEMHLESLNLNTGTLLDGLIVKGNVGKMSLKADSVSLADERALLNYISVSGADIDFFMCDTTVADTATTKVKWCIGLKTIDLNDVSFACRMPCDSVFIDLDVYHATLSDGFVDLGADMYSVSGFSANINELFYGSNLDEPAKGLDFSHLRLTNIGLALDSLYYGGGMNISVNIKEFFAKERSGLVVKSLSGRVEADSVRINIPDFSFETDYSYFKIQGFIPWSSFDSISPSGQLSLSAKARITKSDVLFVIGNTSEAFTKYYPDTMFIFDAYVNGNISNITRGDLIAELPGAFKLNLTGSLAAIANERLRSGKVDCSLETKDIDFIVGMFPSLMQQRFRMPDSISLAGHLAVDKGLYTTNMVLKESEGEVLFSGGYDIFRKSYDAYLKVDSFEPIHFMPDDSLFCLNAFMKVKGQGTDMYHPSTWMELEGKVSDICYGKNSISDVSMSANLKDNYLQAELLSAYPFIKGRFSVSGDIKKDSIKGMVIADVDSLDFYALKLTEMPLATSFQIFSEVESDLDKAHFLDVTLGNWNVTFENQTVQPKMLTLAFRSDADTTRASFRAGDLSVMLTGNADLETLSGKLTNLTNDALKQLKSDTTINFQELRPNFPDMSVSVKAERDNPIYNYLQESNIFFESLNVDARISPEEGINANGALLAFVKDTLKIDTVKFSVWQDTLGVLYEAGVIKNRFRNQESFKANAKGFIRKGEADVFLSFVNSKGENGLLLGVNAKNAPGGFDFRFYPENPVIAFIPFTINNNNFFHFKSLKEMDADLRFEGRANASLWVHSGDGDEAMKEIMVELSQINLKTITDGLADIPSLKGILNTTFRYMPMEDNYIIVADGHIDDLYYENGRVGELLLNTTYMPMEKGTHQVDMHAFLNMSEISSLSVLYKEGRYENKIDGVISINRLPLNLFDVMIPNQMARLKGTLNGNFAITGTDKKPNVNGALKVDSGSVFVTPSSTTLYFDDKDIKMTNNKIIIDEYKIYAQKDNPFVIDGTINAANTSRPEVDLRMSASNLQLINSVRKPESMAFGRLFVNVNSTLRGTPQSLRMRGSMRVLGSTNLTYVMSDSPLEVQDNFSNLVTFTYFADTLPRRARRPLNLVRTSSTAVAASGMDVIMTINIDPVVRLRVELDEEQSNFVELRGGGDLSLQYNTQGDMKLNGRYTLSDGTIRYAIPVIPLTDFTIRNGSFVDWSGDIMNPYLNIAAYTRATSSVRVDGQSRMVDFNTGIQLRDNLQDVSVKFLLEAPTDAVIQNQLTSMGEEERGKQAASLLVTGVYLASGERGRDNLDVGMALNSLLQRELKNMLGSLFGDVPFMFDVNIYDGTQGDKGTRVDYMLKFFKGFYNERLNTSLGVRYSTKDTLFVIDDVSVEYLLDTDGSRAIKAFRSKDYENIFEGEIGKIGASFSIRRKVKRFKDLFFYNKSEPVVVRRDTAVIRREDENVIISSDATGGSVKKDENIEVNTEGKVETPELETENTEAKEENSSLQNENAEEEVKTPGLLNEGVEEKERVKEIKEKE